MNDCIELAFTVVGHPKFAPDYGFGVLKRRSDVNTVLDVWRLMEGSSLLIAEPVGNKKGEMLLIICYDWQSKFHDLSKISNLKKYHHFIVDSRHTGKLHAKTYTFSYAIEVASI